MQGEDSMSDTLPEELNPDYAILIGRVASSWSAVEANINFATWAVAGIAPALGACMTAQINSLDGRLRALLALLKLRRAPASLIKNVNKFADEIRGPNERRNRIIHDAWYWNSSGQVARMEVVAPRKLKMDLIETSLDDLRNDLVYVREFTARAVSIKESIYAALPSLPGIPPEELEPIVDPR
jgi:hypothetical protein